MDPPLQKVFLFALQIVLCEHKLPFTTVIVPNLYRKSSIWRGIKYLGELIIPPRPEYLYRCIFRNTELEPQEGIPFQAEFQFPILPELRAVGNAIIYGVLHPAELIEVCDHIRTRLPPLGLDLRQLQLGELAPITGGGGQRRLFRFGFGYCKGRAVIQKNHITLYRAEGFIGLRDLDDPCRNCGAGGGGRSGRDLFYIGARAVYLDGVGSPS